MANKYGARKVKTSTGETFDSVKEYNRYRELLLLARAGKIHDVIRQVKFELIPKQDGERACNYIADFVYWEGDKMVVEDVKGYKNGAAYELFKIKRKLMLARHGIRIREV